MEEDSTHPPPNDQIDSDLALAMQLQAMEEAEAMSQQKQDSDFLNLLKQQVRCHSFTQPPFQQHTSVNSL